MVAFDEASRQQGLDSSTAPPLEYGRWFPDITRPDYPSAKAKIFEGAKEAVSEGSEELNKAAEKYVKNDAEDRADKLSKEHLSDLTDVYNQVFPNQQVASLTPSKLDADGYDTSKVPPAITEKLTTAAKIKAARDQGGLPSHVRDLQFKVDAYLSMQEARKNAGPYQDYTTQAFARVLGFTPTANEVRKTMLADLNEAFNKKDQELNKLETKLGEYNHIPGVADIRTKVTSGKMTIDEGWHDLARITAFKAAGDYAKVQTEVRTAQQGEAEDYGRAAINAYGPGVTSAAVKGTMGSVFPTPESIDKGTDDDWRMFGTKLQIAKMQTQRHLDAYYSGWKDGEGKYHPGIKDRMPEGAYEKARNDAMSEFANWEKIITDKDTGTAHRMKNAVEVKQDTLKYNVLKSNSQTANWYKSQYLLKEFGLPGFQYERATTPGYGPVTDKNQSARELDALLGSAAGDVGLGGVRTMMEGLGLIKAEEKDKNPGAAARHINDIRTGIESSTTVDPAKDNLVKYAFGPGTEGWLGKVNMEGVDPNTGEKVTNGRHAVFWQYGEPEMVANIKKLGGAAYSTYQSWMENTFRRDIIAPDLANLKNLQRVSGMQLKLHVDNSGKQPIQFELLPGGNPSTSPTQAAYGVPPYAPDQIKLEIHKLNTALKTIHNVEGLNSNGIFLEMLHAAQVDMSGPRVKDNMFEHILLSVEANRAPKEGSKKEQGSVGPQLSPSRPPVYSTTPEEARAAEDARLRAEPTYLRRFNPNRPWGVIKSRPEPSTEVNYGRIY